MTTSRTTGQPKFVIHTLETLFPPIIGDKEECSVILEYDYDSRRFVANGAAEGESAARSGIEESL